MNRCTETCYRIELAGDDDSAHPVHVCTLADEHVAMCECECGCRFVVFDPPIVWTESLSDEIKQAIADNDTQETP